MTFKLESNTVYDDKDRALATISFVNKVPRVRRTCACTIGEYFAILTWLIDFDEQVATK